MLISCFFLLSISAHSQTNISWINKFSFIFHFAQILDSSILLTITSTCFTLDLETMLCLIARFAYTSCRSSFICDWAFSRNQKICSEVILNAIKSFRLFQHILKHFLSSAEFNFFIWRSKWLIRAWRCRWQTCLRNFSFDLHAMMCHNILIHSISVFISDIFTFLHLNFFNKLDSIFLQMQLECFLLWWIMMLILLSISSALLTSSICSNFAELISLSSFSKSSMLVFSFFEFMTTSSSSILSDSMSRLISSTANAHLLNNWMFEFLNLISSWFKIDAWENNTLISFSSSNCMSSQFFVIINWIELQFN